MRSQQTCTDIIERLRNASEDEFSVLERALAADTRLTVKKALNQARARLKREREELARVRALYDFDLRYSQGTILGLDEVGRGSVAGPLAVGAVVLSYDTPLLGLNDSKQLSAAKREEIAALIQHTARAYTVEFIPAEYIDAHGMSAALKKVFIQAIQTIEQAGITLDCILLDGLALHIDEREQSVIKGDAQSAAIAAASIIAKVQRDSLMMSYAHDYPDYAFEKNKGYASEEHREAIWRLGLTPLHRKSFCSGFLQDSLF